MIPDVSEAQVAEGNDFLARGGLFAGQEIGSRYIPAAVGNDNAALRLALEPAVGLVAAVILPHQEQTVEKPDAIGVPEHHVAIEERRGVVLQEDGRDVEHGGAGRLIVHGRKELRLDQRDAAGPPVVHRAAERQVTQLVAAAQQEGPGIEEQERRLGVVGGGEVAVCAVEDAGGVLHLLVQKPAPGHEPFLAIARQVADEQRPLRGDQVAFRDLVVFVGVRRLVAAKADV